MKKAFTLAEVLITLGIIGIVAALTIPTFITEYRKKEYVTRLKTTYNLLDRLSKSLCAETGSYNWADTKLVSELHQNLGEINSSNFDSKVKTTQYKDIVYQHLNKHINITDVKTCSGDRCTQRYFNYNGIAKNTNFFWFYLPNGVILEIRLFTATNDWNWGYINVDVNGLQKPNRWGYDVYQFYISENAQIVPAGSQLLAELSNNAKNHWSETNAFPWFNCSTTKASYGQGCTGRVLEENDITYNVKF